MRLTTLHIAGFRNIPSVRFQPCGRFNLIYGLNGQGKTNLLEALYLLGSPRSFRHARLPDYIGYGRQKAEIRAEIEATGRRIHLGLTLENAGRRMELDGKTVQRASDLFGTINTVVFSPDDTAMIKLGPECRRRYLDRAVYTADGAYLHSWHGYQRILKQRNQLLKNENKAGLDTWTERLAETGAEIVIRRQRFVSGLEERLQRHYRTISGDRESASLSYGAEGIRATERSHVRLQLRELLERHLQSDLRSGTTTAGPHRDDLLFRIDGRPLKTFGSNGQQKSFILALKMAELDNLSEIFGEPPLLLLDDVSSELDAVRNRNFLDFLADMNVQAFISATERSPALLGTAAHYAVFRMEDGNLTFEGTESNE